MSPFVLSECKASYNHFLALSTLFYFQNNFATAKLIAGSAPHCSIATAVFFLRVLKGYILIAIAQIYPLLGHYFKAFDKVEVICFEFLPLIYN